MKKSRQWPTSASRGTKNHQHEDEVEETEGQLGKTDRIEMINGNWSALKCRHLSYKTVSQVIRSF